MMTYLIFTMVGVFIGVCVLSIVSINERED